jgi:glycosyltransferase involved in cell wall biosynthesis
MLLGVAHSLEVKHVLFTEFLSDSELNACYATASAFLCMSEHEGFCAPLMEAMAWDVPVFANAAAAVPETLGGAGVLFENTDCATIAETIGQVLTSPKLKESILAKQKKRFSDYRSRDVWSEFSKLLGI